MKKAILLLSFGTTHEDTRKLTIDVIEKKVKDRFKDYEIRRAFTAHRIIDILKKRDGIIEFTPEEALNSLAEENFTEVIVQPLHIIPGEEYDYIKKVVHIFNHKNIFERLKLGRPILYFKGIEDEVPDDYEILVEALGKTMDFQENILFMGHGTKHHANACYLCLQQVLRDRGYNHVYIANVEGYPTLEHIIPILKKEGIKKLKLTPLMVVAGDHAKNDMAGDEEDSWKNILLKEGFEIDTYIKGLGEISEFQDLYIKHIEDVIENRYLDLGKTKKGMVRR